MGRHFRTTAGGLVYDALNGANARMQGLKRVLPPAFPPSEGDRVQIVVGVTMTDGM